MSFNLLDWYKLVKRPFGLCIIHSTLQRPDYSGRNRMNQNQRVAKVVLMSDLYTVLGVQRQFTVFQIIS